MTIRTVLLAGVADPEEVRRAKKRVRQRRWRAANRERAAEYQRQWREKNRERLNAYWRDYYAKNLEQRRAYLAAWRRSRREAMRDSA